MYQSFLDWQSLRHIRHQTTNFAAMSRSTKNRKQRSTNMSRVLLKELQATIAFACFDSPSLMQRGESLSEAAIEGVMASIYYGDDTNPRLPIRAHQNQPLSQASSDQWQRWQHPLRLSDSVHRHPEYSTTSRHLRRQSAN